MKFRLLTPSEIEIRVGSAKDTGLSLLLYKDARVDQNILDETIGAFSWQRDHKELKDVIYCGIGIFDKETKQWVWKWDAGSESFSDKEKGEASDSFKRAGFNWGIGRELYTSPFIWVGAGKFKDKYDKFKVVEIGYNEKSEVNKLKIKNLTLGKIVFEMGKQEQPQEEKKLVTKEQIELMKDIKVNIENVLKRFKVEKLEDLDYKSAEFVINVKLNANKGEIV